MIIIFDTETTGLLLPSQVPVEKQPRIIEFAAVLCKGPVIVEQYAQLIQPGIPIPPIITKITGLTAADLEGMPAFNDILPRMCELFGKATMAVGHNLDFDFNMVNNELRRNKFEGLFPWPQEMCCTIQQYEHVFGRWLKQGELYQHFMKKPQEKAHRALDDVLALHECLVAAKFFEEVHNDDENANRVSGSPPVDGAPPRSDHGA